MPDAQWSQGPKYSSLGSISRKEFSKRPHLELSRKPKSVLDLITLEHWSFCIHVSNELIIDARVKTPFNFTELREISKESSVCSCWLCMSPRTYPLCDGKGGKRCSVAWSGEELVMIETTLTDRKISYLKVCRLPLSFFCTKRFRVCKIPRMANLHHACRIGGNRCGGTLSGTWTPYIPFQGWLVARRCRWRDDYGFYVILLFFLFFVLSTHNVSRWYFAYRANGSPFTGIAMGNVARPQT